MVQKFRFEHKITLAYAIIGGLWIAFSDRLILLLFSDPVALSKAQTFKGWFYVITTATLFFVFLRGYIKKLREAQAMAEESNRLKSAFLQNISHEIRTPMNAICGFASLLNKKGLSDDKVNLYTGYVINNSNQLLSIVTDILSLSNIETGQEKATSELVYPYELLSDIFEQFKPIAESKKIELYLNASNGTRELSLSTDRQKLKQALWNVTSNAVKFTAKGQVEISLHKEGKNLHFKISDSGIGIPEEMLEKVFERFIQADSTIQAQYGGMGIGLTIAKAYIELLKGSIKLESQLNKGTIVAIEIPVN
ncbi:MAG: HAMP domain-containing sensor histidine kinase [Tenuifilaceae bacterium]|jgi:signal transduction histidine kinase|nr:HAMP domain-containing sensor histidine kinase [Tenuifilaceae bacterium]